MTIVEKAKKHFYRFVNFNNDEFGLLGHVPEAEKWAYRLKEIHPEADLDVILLAVWLHDISHYVSDQDFDHAVRSEQMAKEFLTKEKYSMRKIIEVCHCIRAHRNRDVKPETLEAKIVACIDSASHMTGEMYIQIAIAGKFNYLFEKINRDFADLTPFPEIQSQLSDLTDNWIKLIQSYRKLNLIPEQEYTK